MAGLLPCLAPAEAPQASSGHQLHLGTAVPAVDRTSKVMSVAALLHVWTGSASHNHDR